MNLESHIERLEAETRQAQALTALIAAEKRYQATRTVAAAVDLSLARYRAAREEEEG
jgi:hypothetical protein